MKDSLIFLQIRIIPGKFLQSSLELRMAEKKHALEMKDDWRLLVLTKCVRILIQ
jgi:hypothetical protein